jgi:SAM-dependent methyltransferase
MIHQTGFWESTIPDDWHYHSKNVNNWLIEYLKDRKNETIYDFGCGFGDYLHNFHLNGFTDITGFEGDPKIQHDSFKIIKQNLAEPFLLEKKGIVISLEVGEHIPSYYEQIFLENLANNCSDLLILSWAIRGQGGRGHFNEQNNDEVIPKIESLGFELLQDETQEIRKVPEIECFYFKNTLMVFKRKNK